MIHSMLDIGLDQIAGDRPVFVNLPQEVILSGLAKVLPPDRCLLEILESVSFTPEVLHALEELKSKGYRLALDDFVYSDEKAAVLQLADYVKLDIRALSQTELQQQIDLVKKHCIATVAEKIETLAEFRLCLQLGFDYFQGYFLSRPEVMPGKSPTVDILAMTLMVERCQDPMADLPTIAKIVAQNASLSHRLLQAANSAKHGRRAQIGSVREAVNFLGLGFLSKLASLFLLSGLGEKPSSALLLALQRACMCELLASSDDDRNQFYMVGLLSALDFLLGLPIEAIIEPLPIADAVKSAIVARKGQMGKVLTGVISYEANDWKALEPACLNVTALARAYWNSTPQVEQMRVLVEDISHGSSSGAGASRNTNRNSRL
jgi:c-di-GMP phosphodiesterase